MAGVVAWPACYGSSHPGHPCRCFRLVGMHVSLLPNIQQGSAHKHSMHQVNFKKRGLRECCALAERPVETQELTGSNIVTDSRTSANALLNTVDDPQESIAHHSDILKPLVGSDGQAPGQSTSSYTKAERANLANIPEEQMTPEMLRRWRISKANKGKKPWNKGRQHPPETLARIREGTKAAMMRPEVLARVRANHPSLKHTSQTKAKIGASVSASRKSSRAARPKASSEEADPTGSLAKKDSKDLKPKRKSVKKPAAAKAATAASSTAETQRLPNTADAVGTSAKQPSSNKGQHSAPTDKRVLAEEHRKNISAAIRMKWADPEYRMRALSGMRGGVVQAKRQSTTRVNAVERSREARAQLLAAKARHDKLLAARRTVGALQAALQAGQAQAEALRGDPEGFARQQVMLDDASQLVALAQAKVAELEANTPSLQQVAADLGAKPPMGTSDLTPEEEASIATDIIQQAHPDRAAYAGQQLRLEGPSHDRPLDPTVSGLSAQGSSSQSGETAEHAQHPSSSSDTPPQLVPTHSYRHGMLQHDRTVDRNDSTRDDTAAELQPA